MTKATSVLRRPTTLTFCTQLQNKEDFQDLDEELGIVHLPRELLEHEYLEQ